MLRQRFWAQYLEEYDADGTGAMSHIELTTMLDSLGSTLRSSTLDAWFTRFNKDPKKDELLMTEAILCLEEEINRPLDQKKRLSSGDESFTDASAYATPARVPSPKQEKGGMDFTGPAHSKSASVDQAAKLQAPAGADANANLDTQPGEVSGNTRVVGSISGPAGAAKKGELDAMLPQTTSPEPSESDESPFSPGVERVINIKECPLCHRPRMNKKGEADIVTHLAVCASGDGHQIDKFIVNSYVTASQAQRKWYTTLLGKITSGAYNIGAVSPLLWS